MSNVSKEKLFREIPGVIQMPLGPSVICAISHFPLVNLCPELSPFTSFYTHTTKNSITLISQEIHSQQICCIFRNFTGNCVEVVWRRTMKKKNRTAISHLLAIPSLLPINFLSFFFQILLGHLSYFLLSLPI